VGLVDVGHVDEHYPALIPDKPFSEIRKSEPEQFRYFLGEYPEGLGRSGHEVGAQLTPPRMFLVKDADKYLPLASESFHPMQSLALGGLAAGWGAGSPVYEDFELRRAGLPAGEMRPFYEQVVREIGVSGAADDDVSPHLMPPGGLQDPLEIDSNAAAIFENYRRRREGFLARGFKLGRPPVAVLTRALGERQPNPYHDMDFWSDARESVYRPRYTLRALQKLPNFTYINKTLAVRFHDEEDGGVVLQATDLGSNGPVTFRGRRLLLAAGAINTTRLVLRSLNRYGTRVPVLCNPYTYVPCLNLPMLGREACDRRHSLVQLTGILFPPEAPEEEVVAQFYSYRSLLLFRLAREMPLTPRLSFLMARLIVTSLVIVGVNHPDVPSPDRYLELREKNGGEEFFGSYERSDEERKVQKRRERLVLRNLLALRCVPLQVLRLPAGASIHYAGTLPFRDGDEPLTCTPEGRIRGTRNVYAADGSPWNFLPAKGLTLTLMANARRVAAAAVKGISSR